MMSASGKIHLNCEREERFKLLNQVSLPSERRLIFTNNLYIFVQPTTTVCHLFLPFT